MKKLYRLKNDKKLAGVCSGLGAYFDIDATIIRIAFVVFGFMGWGVLAYIICALVIPEDPNEVDYYQ